MAAIQEATSNAKLAKKKPAEGMTSLRTSIWTPIQQEMSIAAVARGVIGQAALDSTLSSTVVAMAMNDEACLFQFDHQGAPEQATQDLPFLAIGSGQPLADPFLALLRRLYWPTSLPKLADGVFAAVWTLLHAVVTNPGGVSEPIQVVTLERRDGKWRASEVDLKELEEHRQAVSAAEQAMIDFRTQFQNIGTGTATEPPAAPESIT